MTNKLNIVLAAAAILWAVGGCGGKKNNDTATPPSITTFVDSRDGKRYRTVQIGTQRWMAENLNYAAEGSRCYGEGVGVVIKEAEYLLDYETRDLCDKEIQDNCAKYGRLYQWETAKNVCPAGWHLANKKEWQELIKYVGGKSITGTKLKSSSDWKDNGNGSDDYGFSALPGGYCFAYFQYAGYGGYWWSVTGHNAANPYFCGISTDNEGVDCRRYSLKGKFAKVIENYYSVRCVQDTVKGSGK